MPDTSNPLGLSMPAPVAQQQPDDDSGWMTLPEYDAANPGWRQRAMAKQQNPALMQDDDDRRKAVAAILDDELPNVSDPRGPQNGFDQFDAPRIRQRLTDEAPWLSQDQREQAVGLVRQAAPGYIDQQAAQFALRRARERAASGVSVQSAGDWVARRAPFLRAIPAFADSLNEIQAGEAVQAGRATDWDWRVLAEKQVREEQEGNRSFGGDVLEVASQLPATVGEFAMLGGAGGAGRSAGEGVAAYAGRKVAAALPERIAQDAAVQAAGRGAQGLAGAAGAGAARAAVSPGTYAGAAARVAGGESAAPALLRSYRDEAIQNAAFEGAQPFEKQVGDAAWQRVAKGLASGMTANELAGDLQGLAGLDPNKGGPLVRLAAADPGPQREKALKDVAAQLVAFGGLEGLLNVRAQARQAGAEAKASGLGADAAAEAVMKRLQASAGALPAGAPPLSIDDVEQANGPLRPGWDPARGVSQPPAQNVPPAAPPAAPAGGPPPPEPGTGLINPVQTGVPGIVSGAVEVPLERPTPQTPREQADDLEVEHNDLQARLLAVQATERRLLSEEGMGMNVAAQRQAAAARRQQLQLQLGGKGWAPGRAPKAGSLIDRLDRARKAAAAAQAPAAPPAEPPAPEAESAPALSPAEALLARMRRRQAGLNVPTPTPPAAPEVPGEPPFVAPEPLTDAERAAEERTNAVGYEDIPRALRDRSAAVIDALGKSGDAHFRADDMRETHRAAFAGGGAGGLDELLKMQEERLAGPAATAAPARGRLDWEDARDDFEREYRDALAAAARSAGQSASLRRRLAARVQGADADAAAATAGQADPGLGGDRPAPAPAGGEAGGDELTGGLYGDAGAAAPAVNAAAKADYERQVALQETAPRLLQQRVLAELRQRGLPLKGPANQNLYNYRRLYGEADVADPPLAHALAKTAQRFVADEPGTFGHTLDEQDTAQAIHDLLRTDPAPVDPAPFQERAWRDWYAQRQGRGDAWEPPGEGVPEFDPGELAAAAPGARVAPPRPEPADPVLDAARRLNAEEGGSLDVGRLGQIYDRLKGVAAGLRAHLAELAGAQAPRTTAIDAGSGEALARFNAAPGWARAAAPAMLDRVLGPDATPADRRLAGAVLTERRLRYMRDAFGRAGDPDAAANVQTVVGQPNSPLGSEAEYRAALASPQMQGVIARWKQHMVPVMEEAYRRAQGLDDADPIDTLTQIPGEPVSLKGVGRADAAAGGGSVVFTNGGRGNLKNPRLRKLPFSRQATGASEGGYDVDLGAMIEHSLSQRFTNAAKAELFRTLEANGLGAWGLPGRPHDFGGAPAWEVPNVKPPPGTQQAQSGQTSFYADPRVAGELRRALAVDEPWSAVPGSGLLARVTLASSLEGVTHLRNQLTMMLRPGMSPIDLFGNLVGRARGNPDVMSRVAELARIGAWKEGGQESGNLWGGRTDPTYWMGRGLSVLSDGMRLTASDAFDRLAQKGLVEDTETNRRDFINQLGQYNKRSQSSVVAFLRDTGIAPFATAGTNYYMQGLRGLTMNPGVRATSPQAATRLRVEMALRTLAVMGLAPAINYAVWGRVDGDDKTPFGQIKVGQGADGSTRTWDLAGVTGVSRGLRETGALAMIEGARAGAPEEGAEDRAAEDVGRSLVQPVFGPVGQFGWTAATGKNTAGIPVAETAKPGERQWAKNLKAAGLNVNPGVATLGGYDRAKPKPFAQDWDERAWKMLGPFGVKTRRSVPGAPRSRGVRR